MSSATDLLELRPEGLYCPPAGVYIDPHRPVGRAVVTHGHGDHCRPGSRALLATPQTLAIAAARYGRDAFARTQALVPGEPLTLGEATIRLVPAGHVLGSAQVVIEAKGARAVVSGDYKRAPDPTCAPFEPVECDLFVTEATFGLPVFRHPPVGEEIARLLASVAAHPQRCHAIGAYALGKAQRLIAELRAAGWDRPIYLHGALVGLCTVYEREGVPLGPLEQVGSQGKALAGEIVLAPPGALNDRWARRLPDPVICAASGWMRVRQRARQRGVELPLVISDHADWDELTATILETRAQTVWVTHGAEEALCHWCGQRGIDARPLALVGRGEEEAM
ncbi:ligase-associated DNA damage response exonuclease [Albimonas sp. CAU 1670]|uniref:ligase-associated DNA damage response exonuclease n=1 Tax=Albimonas sp. CAU 1670 TaxID=3032599 RepID=UPI0023DC28B1|nr:ligase-associated DNA damage response exonuclease [Albimonas sp. CAU 1670]MDF2231116.1 ligase-associated DNA damage response exonuclease [Albimonas sp. CAU 1670]